MLPAASGRVMTMIQLFDWVKRPCALEGGGVTRYDGTKFYCKEVNGEGLQREFTRANSANELQR